MKSNRGKYRPSKEADDYAKKHQRAYLSDKLDQLKAEKPKKNKQPRARSFDDWAVAGFRIRKGEKSKGRDPNGAPIFTFDQVWKPDNNAPGTMRTVAQHFAPPSTPVPTSCPPVKPSASSWSQPSGLVKEVLARMETKKKEEEASHMHMPEDFDPTNDDYSDLPY